VAHAQQLPRRLDTCFGVPAALAAPRGCQYEPCAAGGRSVKAAALGVVGRGRVLTNRLLEGEPPQGLGGGRRCGRRVNVLLGERALSLGMASVTAAAPIALDPVAAESLVDRYINGLDPRYGQLPHFKPAATVLIEGGGKLRFAFAAREGDVPYGWKASAAAYRVEGGLTFNPLLHCSERTMDAAAVMRTNLIWEFAGPLVECEGGRSTVLWSEDYTWMMQLLASPYASSICVWMLLPLLLVHRIVLANPQSAKPRWEFAIAGDGRVYNRAYENGRRCRKVEGPRGTLYLVPPLGANGEPRMIERGSLELAACGGAGPCFYLPERLCDAAGLSGKGTRGRQLNLGLPADAPVNKNGWFQLGPTARSHASTLAGHVGWGVAILSDQYTGEVRPLRVAQPADAVHSGPKRVSTMDTEALWLLILETCPKKRPGPKKRT